MKIAAEHAEAHRESAGKGMEKRLFLDGIELQSADVSMRHEEFAAAIEADAANAVQAVGYHAAMPAGKAAQLSILQVFV